MTGRFGREARLRRRDEFKAVEKAGRRSSGRYVTLVGRATDAAEDRLGIIASRRIGDAVTRNRAKRRIRELFRRRDRSAGRRFDVVAIAKAGVSDAPFADVQTDFLAALSKLRGAR
jgi:ribonuclease P protein component